jgi:hypothetical protein
MIPKLSEILRLTLEILSDLNDLATNLLEYRRDASGIY